MTFLLPDGEPVRCSVLMRTTEGRRPYRACVYTSDVSMSDEEAAIIRAIVKQWPERFILILPGPMYLCQRHLDFFMPRET